MSLNDADWWSEAAKYSKQVYSYYKQDVAPLAGSAGIVPTTNTATPTSAATISAPPQGTNPAQTQAAPISIPTSVTVAGVNVPATILISVIFGAAGLYLKHR